MRNHFALLLAATCLMAGNLRAQELLTIEEAVRLALANNYDIRISANNVAVAGNNVSLGNAGMLPSVDATLTDNNGIQNSRQVRADGDVTERRGARNTSLNYGVGLSWTIFDGLQMFARYDQLKELRRLEDANFQLAVVTTVSDVFRTYYELVAQQQQLTANDTALVLSNLRLNTARARYQIGQASKLEALNAEVDYNTDTTALLRQQELYNNTRIRMNTLLARDPHIPFRVIDTIAIDRSLDLVRLQAVAEEKNPALQAVLISRRVAELNLKIVKGQRYPAVAVNTGYNFSNSTSALGFATSNTGRGLTYGVTASVNLFNGLLQRRNEQNARLQINSARIQTEQQQQAIRSQLGTAWQTYRTSLALVALEERNERLARQNMDITLDKFRYGTITPVEFREAQQNYINATVRYINASYAAKVAEVALKEIAGVITL